MPLPLLRPYMGRLGDPDLGGVLRLHTDFMVAGMPPRGAYAQYHDQPVAIVVVKDGKVLRFYKNTRFPRAVHLAGEVVPKVSCYHQAIVKRTEITDLKPGFRRALARKRVGPNTAPSIRAGSLTTKRPCSRSPLG